MARVSLVPILFSNVQTYISDGAFKLPEAQNSFSSHQPLGFVQIVVGGD